MATIGHKITSLNRRVIDHFHRTYNKGIVGSTDDIGDYLEHITRNDKPISDNVFDTLVEELSSALLAKSIIYQAGNWDSYTERVLNKGFISQQEKHRARLLKEEEKEGNKHRIIFRDTEFPVDDETGRYR